MKLEGISLNYLVRPTVQNKVDFDTGNSFLVQSGGSGIFRSPWVTCSGVWQTLSITFFNIQLGYQSLQFYTLSFFAKDKIVYDQENAISNFSAAKHWSWRQQ